MKSKDNTTRETPITDGDTRPDQNLDGQKKKQSPLATPSDKKPMTHERGADVNTLEDFKDAKDA